MKQTVDGESDTILISLGTRPSHAEGLVPRLYFEWQKKSVNENISMVVQYVSLQHQEGMEIDKLITSS